MLYAGVTTVDISPWKGLELAGYPHYPRHNTSVHDPLYASCLYLRNGEEELAFVTLDILFFSKKYLAAVRSKTEARCGISAHKIAVACSHTHSGPWASGKLDMEALLEGRDDPDEEYVNFLVEAVARAIELAKRDAFPAALGAQTAVCGAERGVGGNRREKGGICDPSVNVIAVRDEDKVIRGIFLSYALHPTFIHEDSDVVTADYPGSIRRCFAESHPQAVFGFAQGTSGDQSSRYFRTGQSYSEADRVGGEMYRAALEAIDSMTFDADPVLATACAEIPIELREYDPIPVLKDRAEQAVAAYEQLKAAGADYLSVQNANLRMLGAEDILGYATLMEHGTHIRLLHDENPAEVMALRLGDACIACFPGEVFVEYGLRVKAVSPFRLTMVTELKGCLPGYCYTPEGERAGGYEVDTSMLARDFGEKMTALLSQQVRKVWER